MINEKSKEYIMEIDMLDKKVNVGCFFKDDIQ